MNLIKGVTGPFSADIDIRSGDVVFALDSRGRFVYWNAEAHRAFGYSQAEVLGVGFDVVCPPGGAGPDRARFSLKQVMEGKDFSGGFHCRSAGGTRLALYIYATAGRDESGKVNGIVCVGREVTEFWRAEQAVRVSEEKYRLLFDLSSDLVLLTEPNGRIIEANKAVCKLSGYPKKALVGMSVMELLRPDKRRAAELVFSGLRHKTQLQAALEFKIRSGRKVIVEFNASVITVEGKELVFGIGRDITERIESEQATSESEEKYRRLFASVKDGMFLETLDSRILDVNEGACRLLGYTRDELLGKRVEELMPKETVAGLSSVRETLLRRGEFSGEAVNLRKDGSAIPVEVSCSLVQLGGEPLVLVLTRDISERKRTEAALYESEESFRAVAENASDGILISTGEGVHVYANTRAAVITGYSVEELLKMGIRDLVHPDEVGVIMERYRRRLAGKAVPSRYETSIVRKGGTRIPVEVAAAKSVWHGQVANLVVLRDISERKRAEELLQKMSETAMEFVEMQSDSDIYQFIAEKLEGICPDVFISVSSHDEDKHRLRVRKVVGSRVVVARVSKLVGDDVTRMCFEGVSQEAKRVLTAGQLTRVPAGMYDAFFHRVPRRICEAIEETTGLKDVYSIGLRREGRLFGVITFFVRAGTELNKDIVETFASQASIALERRRAERALRESNKRFRSVADNANEWIWEVDAKGLYTYASRAVSRILGYEPDEVVGRLHFYDLFHPDERDELKRSAFEVFARRESFREFPNRSVHKDGRTVWLVTSGAPIVDEQGELAGYRGADTDVTERKRAEQALRESEENFRTLAENANDGFLITDEEGRFVYVNGRAAEMLGYEANELPGVLFTDLGRLADTEKFRELQRKRLHREPVPGRYEAVAVRKDGTELEVEIAAAVTAWKNQPATLIVLRDISERRRAERALRSSEERYRNLVELSPDGIAVHQDGRVVMVNCAGARMLGYDRPEEFVGQEVMGLVHPEDRAGVERRAGQALQEGKTGVLTEERFRQKDGSWVWVEVVNAPFVWKGRPAVQVVVRDVSERKRLAGRVEELATQMQAIFESSPDGLAAECEGCIAYANKAFAALYGYEDPSELIGKPVVSVVAPEDRERLAGYTEQRMHGGEAPSVYRFKGLRRDGTVVELESTVTVYRVHGKIYILGTLRAASRSQ